ncbi:hypothetical protein [Paraliobacillus sediminis]|uniref:hypothetical protein n=1 Tax=Paraliobacillus sediminis TaxID=1885916 RepID=UPI000E3CC9F0|nr:hypothetical protein [Paraliobacillus sediminis]
MANKEAQWQRWEKIRKMGKWKYVLLYGVLLGGILFFLISWGLDYFFTNTFEALPVYILNAVIFGLIYGIISWFFSETRYKKYFDNKTD